MSIKILINNRYRQLMSKLGNNQIKVYKFLWDEYKDKFDFDKVWKTESEWKDKGVRYLNDGDFTELSNTAKKHFQSCLIEGEDVNFDEFVIDLLIHMNLDNQFVNNPMRNFNFKF